PSGYFFTLETYTPTIWLGVFNPIVARDYPTKAEIAVRVQDGQGRPVDGVPVLFEVEPTWAQSVVLSPSQTMTHAGMAQAILSQPQTTGMARVTAHVDNATAHTYIVVKSFEQRQGGE